MDAAFSRFQQLNVFFSRSSAEDDAKGFSFVRLPLVFCQPFQVKFHLTFISRRELADFQIQRNEAAEFSVIKKEVEIIILAVDDDPLLPGHKREADAKLKDEGFNLPNDGRFEVFFSVSVLESQEIEDVWVAENQVG